MRVAVLVITLLFALVFMAPAGAHANHVVVPPQISPNGVVYIESVFVVDEVWLVLHDDADGTKGQPIGQTFIDQSRGPVTDVAVKIPSQAWSNMRASQPIWIDLYFDNGDGRFDASSDESLSPLSLFSPTSFTVQRGDTRAYLGVHSTRLQRTTGTVNIRRAILPENGYLVIRNDSNGGPGVIVGHTALKAGNHTDVSIRLNATFFENRPSSFGVWVMLYMDDGNGELDEKDRSVTVGNQSIRSALSLSKRESSTTSTPAEAELVTTPTMEESQSGNEQRDRVSSTDDSPQIGVSGPVSGLVLTAIALVAFVITGRYLIHR
jgi:hypothetical protein